jgi:polysaccharide chain length determinant protein (PEP-CTERM system associated)
MNIQKIEIGPYLEIARRRRLWVAIPFLLSLIIGIGIIIVSDKMYKASTTILIEEQTVSSSYVEPSVRQGIDSQLKKISKQINSRANLTELINEYNLEEVKENKYIALINKIKKPIENIFVNTGNAEGDDGSSIKTNLDTIHKVRENIDIQFNDKNQGIEISFQWHNAQLAADVTNALATQFISQSLNIRQDMVIGTTNFLDSEVDRIRKELIKKEMALEEFKRKHMGMLPNQLQSNLNISSQLKEELSNLETKMESEKQRYLLLSRQLALNMNQQDPNGESLIEELKRQQDNLDELLIRYTDNHPDVQSLKRRIEKLKIALKNQNDEKMLTDEEQYGLYNENVSFSSNSESPELQRIQNNINRYQDKINQIRAQLQTYRNRIENTSQVELELINLERDYDTVNKRYQDLLSKKLNAQLAEKLEQWQKGEHFRIVDEALPPIAPYKPDIARILLVAVALGLGLGGGAAYMREMMDPGFYAPEEIESYLETEVVVSFPFDDQNSNKRKST